MSDTVKLIIEIDKDKYERCKERKLWSYDAEILEGAVAMGIPLDENKGEWIPVSERLPEKNVWVLVTVEQNEMRYQEIMRRNNYKEGWTDNIDFYADEITAWQPLPEPYKAEGVSE